MWFCVAALSVSDHPDGSVQSQERLWEEHFFLLVADNAGEARTKAENLARRGECVYEAANRSTVSWEFKTVSAIYQLDGAPVDGAEIFSRFLRESEAQSLLTPFADK